MLHYQVMKLNKLLLLFIGIAIFFRLFMLGSMPPGMAHDELDMVLSSRAMGKSGQDISGVPFPDFFFKTNMEAKQTNVIPFLLSPYFRFVKVSLFTARLPFVVINFLLAIALYKFLKIFIKAKAFRLIFLIVFFTNPWMFEYSRRTFAAPTSLMFLVLGLYYLFRKQQKIFRSAVFLIISTLCYYGSFVFNLPIILLSLAYKTYLDKKNIGKYLYSLGFILVIIFGFLYRSYTIEGGTLAQRDRELSVRYIDDYSEEVNSRRRLSINYKFKNLVINKYTIYSEDFLRRYFKAFNFDNLFFSGDNRFTYMFEHHGLLFIIDLPLIVLGIYYLAKSSKKLAIITGFFAISAPLGVTISVVLYSSIYRSAPLSLMFIILISFGLYFLYRYKRIFSVVLILYLAFFVNFLVFYFTEYPVSKGENFDIPERVASEFALREEAGKEVYVVANIPYHIAKQVVFYGQLDQPIIVKNVSNYDFGNIKIISDCEKIDLESVLLVDEKHKTCNFDLGEPDYIIQQQKDSGYRYKIYNSNLCEDVSLDTYKRFYYFQDYNMQAMSNQEFCNRWIFEPL